MIKKCIALLLCFLFFTSYGFFIMPINIKVLANSQPLQQTTDGSMEYEWDFEVIEVPETVGQIDSFAYKDGVWLVKGSEWKIYRTLDLKNWQLIGDFEYASKLYNNDEYFFVITISGIFRSRDGLN